MKTKKITKKVKPVSETAKEHLNKCLGENLNISTLTPLALTEIMASFAKLKVQEALWETSEHFNNPDNVSYIKNHYSLDKIV